MAKKKTEMFRCITCNEEKTSKRNYYVTYSDLYSTIGRIPVCKDCIADRYRLLYAKYSDEILALKHCCLNFDIYYDEDLAKTSLNQGELLIVVYMQKLNRNNRLNHLTSYENASSIEGKKVTQSVFDKNSQMEITDEIKFTWGIGFTDDEYRVLETRYKEYEEYYEIEDLATKQTIRELCTIRLLADMARINGDGKAFNESMKIISTKMSDSGIKPNDKNKNQSEEEVFGEFMKIIETKKPVIKRLEEYRDVDYFERYINRNMINPLAVAEGFAEGDYSLENGADGIKLKDDFIKLQKDKISDEPKGDSDGYRDDEDGCEDNEDGI